MRPGNPFLGRSPRCFLPAQSRRPAWRPVASLLILALGLASLTGACTAPAPERAASPPDWPLPVRHVLGAVLLDTGRAREAEAVYRRDLEVFPENGWALAGLARSLEAQGRTDEAAAARQRFERAWAHADVEITASRI